MQLRVPGQQVFQNIHIAGACRVEERVRQGFRRIVLRFETRAVPGDIAARPAGKLPASGFAAVQQDGDLGKRRFENVVQNEGGPLQRGQREEDVE